MTVSSEILFDPKVGNGLGQPWYKLILDKFREPPPAHAVWQENRETFRFKPSPSSPIRILVTPKKGSPIRTTAYDLSAGGIACKIRQAFNVKLGEEFSILIKLPLDKPTLIRAQGRLVHQRLNGHPGARIHGFRFADSMDEASQDQIHQFIVRKQFEMLGQRLK